MDELNTMQRFIVWSLPVLFAITLHEVAHGWVALKLGDRTAQMLGRLTLNPIKHIDPLGTILIPTLMFFTSGFIFGWAKPVPVAWKNLKRPKRDMAIVALAGPMANLIMAIIWGLIIKLGMILSHDLVFIAKPLIYMGAAGVFINILLMVLNLLPIPPLDGGRIMSSVLPNSMSLQFDRIERFGLIILLVLLFTNVLGKIILPIADWFQHIIFSIFAIT